MMQYFLALALVLGCLEQPSSAHDTLYQDLGGEPGLQRITNGALDLYFTDPRLAKDFDNINRNFLQPRFNAFLCRVAGGPCIYKGRSMKASHQGLAVDQTRFNFVVEDLQKSMDRANVSFSVQNRLLARLAPMERDIVTR